MKTKFHIILFLFCFLVAAIQTRAQLISNGISLNYFGQLDNTSGSNFNWTRSIGIGYFGSGFPNSFLHINSNIGLLPENGSIANYGEVFRTDAPADVTTAWRMFSGNVSANEKFNIRNTTATNHVVFGTVQSGHLDFHTNNTFRGRLTSDGTFYMSGASGANPNLGAGVRLMWVPEKAAFRVGEVDGSQWDGTNVGFATFAAGENNKVKAFASTALGDSNILEYSHAHAIGKENEIFSPSSHTYGNQNFILGTMSFVTGTENFIFGDQSFILGENNQVSGPTSYAIGEYNAITTDYGGYTFGQGNQLFGASSLAMGLVNSVYGLGSIVIGQNSLDIGTKNFSMGFQNVTDGECNFSFGYEAWCQTEGSMVVGLGLSGAGLENNIPHSMMLGVNSDSPTIFLSNSGGTLGSWGNVGFGNITSPTHLIDANGNARFRQMPSTAGDVLITGVQESGVGDYSLSTLAFNANGNQYLGGDGDWHPVGDLGCDFSTVNVSGSNHLVAGYSGHCAKNIGIGTSNPTSKLHIENSLSNSGQTIYLRSSSGGSYTHDGINITASGGTLGVRGISSEAAATANTSSSNVLLIGLRGRANSQPSSTDYTGYAGVYGIYGSTGGAASGTNYYAGYFAGDVYSTGAYYPSDESLKSNVQPAESSLEKLLSLEPKSYNYNTELFQSMNLPQGQQTGFLAQEFGQVFPELVKNATQPAELDEEGNIVHEAVNFTGVNYVGLVPHVVDAVQELKAIIDAQQAQIEALTAMVQNCCTLGSDKSMNQGKGSKSSPTGYADFDLQIEKATLDQNVPNPFNSETSITYRIPDQAMVRVRILGQSGQQIDTLVDGLMPKGEYKIIWNASHLPAGMYFYTLEADGVELVKKAVKM